MLRVRRAKKPNILILIFGFAFSGFGDVLMSGFRVLSEQYPMAQNYSPFKYVTLIFKLLLFVSLRVKIATIGVLKVSLGKLTSHVRYLIGDRFCLVSHLFSSGG